MNYNFSISSDIRQSEYYNNLSMSNKKIIDYLMRTRSKFISKIEEDKAFVIPTKAIVKKPLTIIIPLKYIKFYYGE